MYDVELTPHERMLLKIARGTVARIAIRLCDAALADPKGEVAGGYPHILQAGVCSQIVLNVTEILGDSHELQYQSTRRDAAQSNDPEGPPGPTASG